jgi:hypothetical protein
MSWDNTTLTIRGKIETDANTVSQIGDWEVSDGNFQHNSGQIVLDATAKEIKISDSSNIPRVFIKQGTVTLPAAATSIAIDPLASYDFGNFFAPSTYTSLGSINIEQVALDATGVSVTTPGTYVLVSPNWGSAGQIDLASDGNFSGGYAQVSVNLECWTTATRSGTQLLNYPLAYSNGIYNPNDNDSTSINAGTVSIEFPTAGTYYFHTVTYLYGYVPYTSTLTITGQIDATSVSPALQFAQTEIGRDGMIVLSNATNFASIKRTTSEAIIKIATDGSYPGIEIGNTNASATAQAIKVTGGDILCTGAGNNIMVYGGWIGTENTNTGGVRMGVNSGESCLIGSNFPGQSANVAAARLRIASPATKLGITGRELIYDTSSTLRIKRDIEPYPDSAYDTIKKMKAVLFTPLNIINTTTMETDGEEDYTQSYPMENPKEYIGKQGGFIAEWLDEDPDLRRYVVYGYSDGKVQTDTINYDKLVVPLTKAVQILMDKVEALEAYISSSKI